MNVNRVIITGNLTADPDVKTLQSGTILCRLRFASNTRRKQPDGSWGEQVNYFDAVVWGPQGETVGKYLQRGSAVAIDGRLEWREWSTDAGEKRQAVEIVVENLQFLSGTDARRDQAADESTSAPQGPSSEGPASSSDDDIPF